MELTKPTMIDVQYEYATTFLRPFFGWDMGNYGGMEPYNLGYDG